MFCLLHVAVICDIASGNAVSDTPAHGGSGCKWPPPEYRHLLPSSFSQNIPLHASCQGVMGYQLLVVTRGSTWITRGSRLMSYNDMFLNIGDVRMAQCIRDCPLPSHFSSSVFEINFLGWRIKRVACINCNPELIKHRMITRWLAFTAPLADGSWKWLWHSIICWGRDFILHWLHWYCMTKDNLTKKLCILCFNAWVKTLTTKFWSIRLLSGH